MIKINLYLFNEVKTFEYDADQFAYGESDACKSWQCYDDSHVVELRLFRWDEYPTIYFNMSYLLDFGDGYVTMEHMDTTVRYRKHTCKEKMINKVCIHNDIKNDIIIDGYLVNCEEAQEIEDLLVVNGYEPLTDYTSSRVDEDLYYIFVTDFNRNELAPVLKELGIEYKEVA